MYCNQYIHMILYRRKEKEVKKMKRFIKIGDMWLTVENLKELTELLETQETTDKEDPGGYCIFRENYDYEIRVNKDYDLILEEVTGIKK